jgi:hypothetical protein
MLRAGPERNLLERLGEILGTHCSRFLACCQQGGLVHQVAQLGADQTGRLGGDTLDDAQSAPSSDSTDTVRLSEVITAVIVKLSRCARARRRCRAVDSVG